MLNNSNIIDRIRLPFRKEKELFSALHDILGLYPRNIEYYKVALMHKSLHRRNEKGKPINNERLEFLGDAVLDAVAGDVVFRHFPGKREGFLTTARSKLVARDSLGKLALEVGLDRLIMASDQCKAQHNCFMNGNAFEALVGALYLDRGYDACMRFMQERILRQIVNIDKVAYREVNFKSKLLEWCQKNRVKMEFKLVNQTTEAANSLVFECQTVIEGVNGATGRGYTKKESQQQAAKITLHRLRREPKFLDAVFAAKANRTKMEEEPVSVAPDPEEEEKAGFIISNPQLKVVSRQQLPLAERKKPQPTAAQVNEEFGDEFDLSDISACPAVKSREDIIAEAETAAFGG